MEQSKIIDTLETYQDDCGKLKAKTNIIQDAPSKTHIMW